jgi:DNA-binding CsgD family transcriptional regulator
MQNRPAQQIASQNPHLTRAQRRVLDLLMQGHSEDEIASLLDRSYHTVHSHVRLIYVAYGVHSRAELFAAHLGYR